MGDTLAENVDELQCRPFQVDVTQMAVHGAHEPDAHVGLLAAMLLASQHRERAKREDLSMRHPALRQPGAPWAAHVQAVKSA
jgi:hypothetical protein